QEQLAGSDVAPPDGSYRCLEDLAGTLGEFGQGIGRTEREVAERSQDLGASRIVRRVHSPSGIASSERSRAGSMASGSSSKACSSSYWTPARLMRSMSRMASAPPAS